MSVRWVIGVVVVALLTAVCDASALTDAPTTSAGPGQNDLEKPPVLLTAAQGRGAGEQALMTAVLEVRDGCLVFASGGTWIPIWPRGYTLEPTATEWRVVDDAGQPIADVGGTARVVGGEINPVEVGGREAADRWVRKLIGGAVPAACSGGKYWLVSTERYPADV